MPQQNVLNIKWKRRPKKRWQTWRPVLPNYPSAWIWGTSFQLMSLRQI